MAFSANVDASCCTLVSSSRWNDTTLADGSSEAANSSLKIILLTIALTAFSSTSKRRSEVRQRNRLVVRRVAEQVGSQTHLLNALGQHHLDLLRAGHQLPDLDVRDQLDARLAVAVLQRLARLHDVITRVLGWSREDLAVRVVEHTTEGSRDDALAQLRVVAGKSHVGHLEQHRRDQVDALEQLEVDVHVEGELALTLKLLLLRCDGAELFCFCTPWACSSLTRPVAKISWSATCDSLMRPLRKAQIPI